MNFTFELIAATDLNTFNSLVNDRFTKGYKFITGQPMIITPHESVNGHGYQYSVAMLLEEEEQK